MGFLTDLDKQAIKEAISNAERKTRGELVTVIAREADDYLYIPVLWAALLALLVPAFVSFLERPDWQAHTYSIQIVSFILLAVLFRHPVIKMRLIPSWIKQQRAHRVALEQFLLQNLHATEERTGILLFVSVSEHYVEILADKGINDVVDADAWDNIVKAFVVQVKKKQIADGFVQAITSCGELLEEHFPAHIINNNELPNKLIEI